MSYWKEDIRNINHLDEGHGRCFPPYISTIKSDYTIPTSKPNLAFELRIRPSHYTASCCTLVLSGLPLTLTAFRLTAEVTQEAMIFTIVPTLLAWSLLTSNLAAARDHPGLLDGLGKVIPWKRFENIAILGDSYAAGIGAGKVLKGKGDAKCSRYDGAYGYVLKSLSPRKHNFQFKACSGDTSVEIKKQVDSLKDKSQNLVTLSAGGNDALLSEILRNCVVLPSNENACSKAMAASRAVIDKKLQGNIEGLLKKLVEKMKNNGVVLHTLYGTFFNSETNPCDKQSWSILNNFFLDGGGGLKMTKGRRRKLNKLVQDANAKISKAIDNVSRDNKHVKIVKVEWDDFGIKTKGRFCENKPVQKKQIFYMYGTSRPFIPSQKKKIASDSNSAGQNQHDIQKRLPDALGRVFHPTEYGHGVIASRAALALFRALAGEKVCAKRPKPKPKPGKPPGKPKQKCDTKWVSSYPFNAFDLTHKNFCRIVKRQRNPGRPVRLNVNSKGNIKTSPLTVQDPNNPGYPFSLTKRTPPPNPHTWKDITIQYTWRQTIGGRCSASCDEAYSRLARSECGHQGAKQNQMTVEGQIDVGCGVYSYSLRGPPRLVPTKPQETPKQDPPKEPAVPKSPVCYGAHQFTTKGDVSRFVQNILIAQVCGKIPRKTMKQGDKPIVFYKKVGKIPYRYAITWLHNCKSTVTQMNVLNPVKGDKASCKSLMEKSYTECKGNEGRGGYFDVGCLRYEFAPRDVK
ncbi:hypothetical protein PAAG_06286 [Paracoccidioides lutzii Pb01]|uniref:SGNH hydrolase-type esterase domain-containing protein n=1 Tax=Paracoccidioides lutzii (strain ATCC MYA-826 / Pb01) TaxID=502779 RepID=C1H5U1_PARBA|nr:hypothetical protein PAAG_06286 [Paracoccidioides lutzii Pb01]EEH35239.2 hypothetical protein PAAG_06286 [Paracoccidioides lutzii Pb01]